MDYIENPKGICYPFSNAMGLYGRQIQGQVIATFLPIITIPFIQLVIRFLWIAIVGFQFLLSE
jgi:hypothetical protein